MLLQRINDTGPDEDDHRDALLRELLGGFGEGSNIRPPFRCEYGFQTRVGARTFANVGLVVLDVARGDDRRRRADRPGRAPADADVGAGSVVPRDLPPGVVAVGNPARVIRRVGS